MFTTLELTRLINSCDSEFGRNGREVVGAANTQPVRSKAKHWHSRLCDELLIDDPSPAFATPLSQNRSAVIQALSCELLGPGPLPTQYQTVQAKRAQSNSRELFQPLMQRPPFVGFWNRHQRGSQGLLGAFQLEALSGSGGVDGGPRLL